MRADAPKWGCVEPGCDAHPANPNNGGPISDAETLGQVRAIVEDRSVPEKLRLRRIADACEAHPVEPDAPSPFEVVAELDYTDGVLTVVEPEPRALKLVANAYDVTDDSGLVVTRTVIGASCSRTSIVRVGPDPYGRRRGWSVYVVHSQVHAECLDADGTWSKYGTSFATAEAALEVLQAHPEGLD